MLLITSFTQLSFASQAVNKANTESIDDYFDTSGIPNGAQEGVFELELESEDDGSEHPHHNNRVQNMSARTINMICAQARPQPTAAQKAARNIRNIQQLFARAALASENTIKAAGKIPTSCAPASPKPKKEKPRQPLTILAFMQQAAPAPEQGNAALLRQPVLRSSESVVEGYEGQAPAAKSLSPEPKPISSPPGVLFSELPDGTTVVTGHFDDYDQAFYHGEDQ